MDYPISHFVSLVALLGARPAGSQWVVKVENLDHKKSPTMIPGPVPGTSVYDPHIVFTVPRDEASLDSDGDGLLDSWEINGYAPPTNDGTVIDLQALGAKPYRKDI